MKSIALTGATSMIGIALINECLERNIEVYAFIRGNSKNRLRIPENSLIKVLECDLDELKSFDESAIDSEIDCFYHIGWAFTDKESRVSCDKQYKNVGYTLDAVRLADKLGCRKFVGAGSQAEYGLVDVPLKRELPCNPKTAYGIAKYSAGKFSELLASSLGLEFNWVRILSVYGKNDNEGTLIKSFIDKCSMNMHFPLSPCTHIWDYLHEKDAGAAFHSIGVDGISPKTYVIGSGEGKALKDYILYISSLINSDYQPQFGEVNYNNQSVRHLEADITEITEDTGWKPQIDFQTGIQDLIQ